MVRRRMPGTPKIRPPPSPPFTAPAPLDPLHAVTQAPGQDIVDCLMGGGLMADTGLFRDLMLQFVAALCKTDEGVEFAGAVQQGPVLWLHGDYDLLTLRATDTIAQGLRQVCGGTVPFETCRKPLPLKNGLTLPPGTKVFAVVLRTHDEKVIKRACQQFEAGRLQVQLRAGGCPERTGQGSARGTCTRSARGAQTPCPPRLALRRD